MAGMTTRRKAKSRTQIASTWVGLRIKFTPAPSFALFPWSYLEVCLNERSSLERKAAFINSNGSVAAAKAGLCAGPSSAVTDQVFFWQLDRTQASPRPLPTYVYLHIFGGWGQDGSLICKTLQTARFRLESGQNFSEFLNLNEGFNIVN